MHHTFAALRTRNVPRRPHGLTLLELLTSLALLAMLAPACFAVLRSTTRAAITRTNEARWSAGANALLDCIAADLAAADLDPVADRARKDPRITVSCSTETTLLTIRSRRPGLGTCTHAYSWNGGMLHILALPPPRDRAAAPSIPSPEWVTRDTGPAALADVARFDAALHTDQAAPTLLVHLQSHAGESISRLFLLDAEPSP